MSKRGWRAEIDSAWNDATVARLRALWAEGLSTAEIGRRMGISKNSVVSKAHRLRLPGRPSPIRREGGLRAARPVPLRPEAGARRSDGIAQGVASSLAALGVVAEAPAVRAPGPGVRRASGGCRFPLWGDRERPTQAFCGAAALAGRSWCAAHYRVVFDAAPRVLVADAVAPWSR